jgi:hypothetical protein
VSSIRTYWERCVVRGNLAVAQDKCDSKKVEGRAQIVDAISDDCAPVVGNSRVGSEIVIFVTRIVRVFIDLDSVWPSCLKSTDGRIKVRKVFFGPINLYANATKVNHDGKVRSDEEP